MYEGNSIGRGVEYLRLVIYHTIRFINPNKYNKQVYYFNLYPLTNEINVGDLDVQHNNDIDVVLSKKYNYFYCLICEITVVEFKDNQSFLRVIDHIVIHQLNDEIEFNNSNGYKIGVKDLVIMRFEQSSKNIGGFFHYYISKLATSMKVEEIAK